MSLITVIKAGGSSQDLYSSDGTLTANRTVTGGGFSLTFTGQSDFRVVSPSASALNTAFAVRNNTNTSDLVKVDGSGVLEITTSAIRALRFTTGDYTLGVDGNGFMTYSTPKINGIFTGHRIGRVDTSGVFTEIGNIQSNDLANYIRFKSINGQTDNLFTLQDHNGNIRFGYNPQTGVMSLTSVPVGDAGRVSGEVYQDTAANALLNGDNILILKA